MEKGKGEQQQPDTLPQVPPSPSSTVSGVDDGDETEQVDLDKLQHEIGSTVPPPNELDVNPISLLARIYPEAVTETNVDIHSTIPPPCPAPSPPPNDTRFSVTRKEGGQLTDDPKLMQYQRRFVSERLISKIFWGSVVFHMLKQAGLNAIQGKSLVNVSLPVRIFEPRSFLTRITVCKFGYV